MILSCSVEKSAATEYQRTPSYSVSQNTDSTLRRAISRLGKSNPGKSGFMLLPNGRDAFLMRIAMIEAAEKSVDLQYYSIRNDNTGQLLLEALLKAADRGVRVRVLIDDLNIKGADETLSVLNQHKSIEIRVFNPFTTRRDSPLTLFVNLFANTEQLFRRMHNKAFIVDNQVAVAGGRNLSDEYFDFGEEFNFHDLDMLAGGPIVASLSKSFDSYWNSEESYPINAVHAPPALDKLKLAELRANLDRHWEDEKRAGEIRQLIPLAQQIARDNVKLTWARAEMAADDPTKLNHPPEEAPSKPAAKIEKLAEESERSFILVSPYFVPQEEGEAWLASLVAEGVRVRVLTNSLASTDVAAVHGKYRSYRKSLVEKGIELYEMKPIATEPKARKKLRNNSLHSKVYVIDHYTTVMGSYNFDPRSEKLNTEMVLVVYSRELAAQVEKLFARVTSPENSYRLVVKDGALQWHSTQKGTEIVETSEPEASLWRHIKANFIAILPVEDQL